MQAAQPDAQEQSESPISFPDAPTAPSVRGKEIVYARRTLDQNGRAVIVIVTPHVSFFLPDTDANVLALTSAGVALVIEPAPPSDTKAAEP